MCRYCIVAHRIVRRDVTWRGVARRGVAWRGVARRGVAWRGVAWRGVAWRGVFWGPLRWVTEEADISYVKVHYMDLEDPEIFQQTEKVRGLHARQ